MSSPGSFLLNTPERILHKPLNNDIAGEAFNTTDLPFMESEQERDFPILIVVIMIVPVVIVIMWQIFRWCVPGDLSIAIDNFINSHHRTDSDRIYGDRIVRQQIEEEEKNKEDPEERRARLHEYFENKSLIMVVKDDSFAQSKKRSDSSATLKTSPSDMSSSDKGSQRGQGARVGGDLEMQTSKSYDQEDMEVYIPDITSIVNENEKGSKDGGFRKIPNCCAICLCGYDVGDTITWSYNNKCTHAFHHECILDYLQTQKSTPCPCCRREFTDMLPKSEDDECQNIEGRGFRGNVRAIGRRLLSAPRAYSSVNARE